MEIFRENLRRQEVTPKTASPTTRARRVHFVKPYSPSSFPPDILCHHLISFSLSLSVVAPMASSALKSQVVVLTKVECEKGRRRATPDPDRKGTLDSGKPNPPKHSFTVFSAPQARTNPDHQSCPCDTTIDTKCIIDHAQSFSLFLCAFF